jgi:polysaccharide export outer membrane protein
MQGGRSRRLFVGAAFSVLLAVLGGCQSFSPANLVTSNKPNKDSALATSKKLALPVNHPKHDAGMDVGSTWQRVCADERVPSTSPGSEWQSAVRIGEPSGAEPNQATAKPRRVRLPNYVAAKHPSQAEMIPPTLPLGPSILPEPRPSQGTPVGTPTCDGPKPGFPDGSLPSAPRELAKVALPPYVIEPPDILLISVTGGPVLPDVQVSREQHLVTPDGTIRMHVIGAIYVAGMTLDQARAAIADAFNSSGLLEKKIKASQVSVDVLAYNSKVYYVITDGGGYGEQVYKFPITGNETVLDAISNINGLPAVSSKKHIWIARRNVGYGSKQNVLPVDWVGLTQGGGTATNYQVFPGDRVYVQSDKLIRIDSGLAKFLSPIERVLGTTLLGGTTYNTLTGRGLSGQGF